MSGSVSFFMALDVFDRASSHELGDQRPDDQHGESPALAPETPLHGRPVPLRLGDLLEAGWSGWRC
jgi:hypothetical protein